MNLRIAMTCVLLATLPTLADAADDRTADTALVPLSELVARVHGNSGKVFILDPSAAAVRISMAGMDAERIDYPMLLNVLRYNGLVALVEKQVVTILPDAVARQLPTPVLTADDAKIDADTLVTRILQVRNACAVHMVPVLRPLMPQSAHLAAYPPTNTLIVADHADNVRRIAELVERIDKAAPAKLDCGSSPKPGS
jgi:general secretion pathway protein D